MSDSSDAAHTQKLLASVPLFSGLGKVPLRTLAESAQEKRYKPDETIVRQGEKGIGFYLILDGQAQVEKAGRPVATLGPGQFFGEMALVDEQPRSADVRAKGPVRCLVLSPWEFWSAVGDDAELLRTLLKETVRRLRPGPAGLSE